MGSQISPRKDELSASLRTLADTISMYLKKARAIHTTTAARVKRYRGLDDWSNADKKWRDEQLEKIRSLARTLEVNGESIQDIAHTIGLDPESVKAILGH